MSSDVFVTSNFSPFFFFCLAPTAEWEARKQSLESKMPSQMRKEAATESRQPETLTQYSRPQVTAAQVESYPMTKKMPEDHRRPSQQMDSSLSASPTATTPQRSIISNAHEAVRGLVLPEDRNLVNSGECRVVLSCVIFSLVQLTHNKQPDTIFGFTQRQYFAFVLRFWCEKLGSSLVLTIFSSSWNNFSLFYSP
jgi:hypothetical protein